MNQIFLSLLHKEIVHKLVLKAIYIEERSNTSFVQTVIEKVVNNQQQ